MIDRTLAACADQLRREIFAHHLVELRGHRIGVHLLQFVSGAGQYLAIFHQHRCAAVHLRLARHLAITTAGFHARTSVVSLGRDDHAAGGVECVVVAGRVTEAFAVWVIFMGVSPHKLMYVAILRGFSGINSLKTAPVIDFTIFLPV